MVASPLLVVGVVCYFLAALYLARKIQIAPEGFQDQRGFHYLRQNHLAPFFIGPV